MTDNSLQARLKDIGDRINDIAFRIYGIDLRSAGVLADAVSELDEIAAAAATPQPGVRSGVTLGETVARISDGIAALDELSFAATHILGVTGHGRRLATISSF